MWELIKDAVAVLSIFGLTWGFWVVSSVLCASC